MWNSLIQFIRLNCPLSSKGIFHDFENFEAVHIYEGISVEWTNHGSYSIGAESMLATMPVRPR